MAVSGLDNDFNNIPGTETTCLTGNDATAQNIINFLCLCPGESCLHPDAGIDWLKEPFLSSPNQRASRRLRAKIETIDFVDRVLSINYEGVPGEDGRWCIDILLVDRSTLNIESKLNGN